MGRIHRLSEELINQIAAGEVVERPASVVKELAENAVDAGATQVRVQITKGGLESIVIIDDGHGMSREDALLALERHATSKLRDFDGLSRIRTKGFRGEAVPAIASVSRFVLRTSEPGATVGTQVTVEGGKAPVVEDCAPPGGTRIEVHELFFNTPARREFLKRESTEFGHCEDAVLRLALPHPGVGFHLEHDGKVRFSSPAALDGARERVATALGPEAAPHLLAIEERRLGVVVTGFVASPEFTLPNARGLSTFVNLRYIRDRGLNAAVQRAYQDSLPPGRQPVAAIFIDVDPATVDVNVHPQKLEVRFSDPRQVQEAVGAAISRALKAAPWRQSPSQPVEAEAQAHYAQAVDRFLSRLQDPAPFLAPQAAFSLGEAQGRASFGTARPGLNEAPPEGYFGALRVLGELGRRFWVCEGRGGTLVVIDPLAVAERVVLQELVEAYRDGTAGAASGSLFSATVTLPEKERAWLVAHAEVLLRLGVEVEPFGGETLAVRRVPASLETADVRLVLLDVARVLGEGGAPEAALAVLARHGALARGRSGTEDERRRLLVALDACDFSVPCERQRVVVQELPLLELESRAG